MRVVPFACALAAVLVARVPAGSAEVRVRMAGDRVDLEATNAPLSDVLAALAEKTGMKVVYDGAPPRTVLTTTLASRAQPEAILALFEGLGLNFALSLDPTGARVETLLVVASGGARAATPPARGAAPVARPTPPPEDPATEGEPEEPPPMEAGPAEPGPETPRPAQPPEAGPRPLQPGMRPGSPFELRPAPLTFPTPLPATQPSPPPAEPAPEPTPTPPGR